MQTADRGWKPRPTPKDHHGSKPTGLWLSVVSEDGGDSWSDYCKTTDTPLKCWRTELLLNDDTIRWVRTPAEIDELTIEYGYCRVPEAEMFKDMIDHTRSVIYWERHRASLPRAPSATRPVVLHLGLRIWLRLEPKRC